jgi:hypothetical protein
VSELGCAVARQAPTKISTRPLQGPCTRCDKGKVAVWATARGVDILDYPLLPTGGGVRAAAAGLPKPKVSAASTAWHNIAQHSIARARQAPTTSSQASQAAALASAAAAACASATSAACAAATADAFADA